MRSAAGLALALVLALAMPAQADDSLDAISPIGIGEPVSLVPRQARLLERRILLTPDAVQVDSVLAPAAEGSAGAGLSLALPLEPVDFEPLTYGRIAHLATGPADPAGLELTLDGQALPFRLEERVSFRERDLTQRLSALGLAGEGQGLAWFSGAALFDAVPAADLHWLLDQGIVYDVRPFEPPVEEGAPDGPVSLPPPSRGGLLQDFIGNGGAAGLPGRDPRDTRPQPPSSAVAEAFGARRTVIGGNGLIPAWTSQLRYRFDVDLAEGGLHVLRARYRPLLGRFHIGAADLGADWFVRATCIGREARARAAALAGGGALEVRQLRLAAATAGGWDGPIGRLRIAVPLPPDQAVMFCAPGPVSEAEGELRYDRTAVRLQRDLTVFYVRAAPDVPAYALGQPPLLQNHKH